MRKFLLMAALVVAGVWGGVQGAAAEDMVAWDGVQGAVGVTQAAEDMVAWDGVQGAAQVVAEAGTFVAAEPQTGIVFAENEHDFGQIDERGKPVSHVFEFANESDKPLVITKIATSCKCTSYDYPRKPVAPGAKGSVKITFAPHNQQGHIYRVIRVETSQGRAMLTIKGEVK